MNLKTSLARLGFGDITLLSDGKLREVVMTILAAESLSELTRDTLRALYNDGPIWDGDLPSKTGCEKLVELGFAVEVVTNGSSGYNACTPLGAEALHIRGMDGLGE